MSDHKDEANKKEIPSIKEKSFYFSHQNKKKKSHQVMI